MEDTVDIVKKWLSILNSGNTDLLVGAGEPDLAIVGPRGTATGAEILREWYAHTRLTFDMEEMLVNGNQVISLGKAHWHNSEGSEVGNAPTAFLMEVSPHGRIAKLSRHDEGLRVAIAASSAPSRSDWQSAKAV